MLYDPKWAETKKPSLKGLVAWLETKNPSESYDWLSCQPCLIEQYCASIGVPQKDVFKFRADGGNIYSDLTTPRAIARSGDTFGAALKRARLALMEYGSI